MPPHNKNNMNELWERIEKENKRTINKNDNINLEIKCKTKYAQKKNKSERLIVYVMVLSEFFYFITALESIV